MDLHLLEFTYAIGDREAVDLWLSGANLSGVLISTQRYDDEIFAVLANTNAMQLDQKKLGFHAAISSCEAKRRALYRITTTSAPKSVFFSFPTGEGDEWYAGSERMIYLSMPSPEFEPEQISWLATCTAIVKWEDMFELTPSAALVTGS